jgi:threonine synthase
VAAIRKLAAAGRLKSQHRIAAILTGSGLKDTSALAHHHLKAISVPVDELDKSLSD